MDSVNNHLFLCIEHYAVFYIFHVLKTYLEDENVSKRVRNVWKMKLSSSSLTG